MANKDVEDRRRRALDLRAAGLTATQIADKLGTTPTQTRRDIAAALRNADTTTDPALEAQRLDTMQRQLWPQVLQGDQKAAETVLRIMERRDAITPQPGYDDDYHRAHQAIVQLQEDAGG